MEELSVSTNSEELATVTQKALQLTDTPPEIAAKNIDRANLFEMSPDSYSSMSSQLDKEAEAIERTPAQIGKGTEEYMTQSSQHAALAKEDVGILSTIEKRATFYKQQIFDVPNLNREITDLTNRKISEGSLSEGEEEYLQNLNQTIGQINSQAPDDIGDKEGLAVEVVSAAGDMIRSYWENKALFAGTVATNTAIAAGAGALAGGVGAGPGAIAGFTAGIGTAMGLVGAVDGFYSARASVYNELTYAVDDQKNPLNIPHDKKANVATTVGIISGAMGAVSGKLLASNNPLLKRFASPKLVSKLLTSSPSIMAKSAIVGGILKSIVSEGTEESLQEVVQIIGTEFGKLDDTEASFENSFTNLAEALKNSATYKTLEQAGRAGLVGGLTGGLFETITSAPGYSNLKENYTKIKEMDTNRTNLLAAKENILNIAEDVKQTKMNKLSPEEMSNFNKKIMSVAGIDENVFFELDELRQFANTPEKGKALSSVLDPNSQVVKMAQQLGTAVEMNTADLIKITTEFPDITDIMKLSPASETVKQAVENSQDFVKRLQDSDARRAEILKSLGVDQDITPEIKAQLDELNKPIKDRQPFADEFDYLDSVSFVEREGVMSKEEAEAFNTTHLDARLAVAKSLKEDVDSKYATLDNKIFKDVNTKDIQQDLKTLDTEFNIVDSFSDTKNKSEASQAITVRHKKKGFSPSAIDPKSLPQDLKTKYLNDEVLRKRKVFVDGGLDLEESAALNGVNSGVELLDVLANTPKKSEIIKNRKQREIELKNRIHNTTNPSRQVQRDAAFSNLTKIYLREMKHLTSKEWPTLKRGIIKIASKVPSVESLNTKAKNTVNNLKVKDLNANRFLQGERKSSRQALKDYVDGKFESAFINKERAAQNNELRKETVNALEKVTSYKKFWKRMSSASNQQELKDAGMSKAMNEFMTLYKLDGSNKNVSEQNSFNKFVKDQVAAGGYVPVIPDRLDNTQVSSSDLTFEQYKTITEMGQFMLHTAKVKNKLTKLNEKRTDIRTAEMVAAEIETNTKKNVNYDIKKTESKNPRYMSFTEKVRNGVATSASSVSSTKTVISQLDNYEINGYFHNLIGEPIKEARTVKRTEISEIESHDKKIIETFYGVEKFKKMFNEFIEVPEFANIPTIGDGEGNIRKVDLLVLQAYMGDPDGKAAMDKFVRRDGSNITVEEIQTVLDTHLDNNDAAFVQNFLVDRFKRFEQRSLELHKKTTGIEPEMIKGETVIHKGKELPGGYYPIKRQAIPDEVKAQKFFDSLKEDATDLGLAKDGHFYSKMRAAEMTQQGRLKERTGSNAPLDLTFENVFDFTEEAVHDLHFREVGIDTLKVLKNPENIKNIKAVVGDKKFTVLLNSIKDTVSKTTERESTLFGEEFAMVNNIIQKAHSLHAVKAIGLNLTSAAIQVDSLPNLMLRVGPKTPIYLAKTAMKIGANLTKYNEFVALAAEINPDIKLEKDGIDNAVVKHSYDFIPASSTFFKKNKNSSADKFARVREIQRKAIDASFSLVREVDKFTKVLSTLAVSEQFLNGDVEGISLDKVESMSEADRAKSMRSAVQQAIDLSLTASAPEDKTALEKNKVASIFTRYWTDRRSRLNTYLAQVDKANSAFKKGENGKAASNLLLLSLAAGASSSYVNFIRDDESLLDKIKKAKNVDADDVADFALDTTWSFIKAPFDQTLDVIPLVDNIKYQSELDIKSDYRNVSTPLFGVASDVAAGVVVMKEVLGMAVKGKVANLSDNQRKMLLTNAGYIIGGAPTNGMNKAIKLLSGKQIKKGAEHLKDSVSELHDGIKEYINTFSDDPEAQDFIEELKDYQKTLPQTQKSIKQVIPENAQEDIKQVSSKGNWNTIDPETGAAGIYQFTEERWNELMELNPDLGLTENGRLAKDSRQQEAAMKWNIEDMSRSLLAYDVPLTTENLLGTHKYGLDNYLAIFSSKPSEKLTKILGEDAKLPQFKKFKTVGSVKQYLKRELDNQIDNNL